MTTPLLNKHCTVEENIIATIKMRNNFCYPLKLVIFPILLSQYWTFLVIALPTLRYRNIEIQKRSHEPIYKTHTKIEAKRLRAKTFAIAKLEELLTLERQEREEKELIPKGMQRGLTQYWKNE